MSEQVSSEVTPQRRLIVRAVLRTDVGLVRSENQDFGTYTTPEEEKESHPGGRLLIVADGMGGHRGGATASRLAAETVKAQFLGSETRDIPTALHQSLVRANARIYSEAQSNPELRGMGTTTSVLAVRGGRGWLAHVGDSRIYLVREGEIRQLTQDHSLVATMVREGLLTTAEAETHPRRNVLQRSMGVAEDVEVDVAGPFELREGDTFILCSDGLHGLVKEGELREIAQQPIDTAADEFLKRALERGAPDNVTVIVARVEAGEAFGDETLVDDYLEETQPLQPFDLLDETQRDTDKLPVVDDADLDTAKHPVVADADPSAPTLEIPANLPPEPAAEGNVATTTTPSTTALPATSPSTTPVPPTSPSTTPLPATSPSTTPTPVVPPPAATARTIEVAAPAGHEKPKDPVAANVPVKAQQPAGAPAALKWTIFLVLILGAAGAWFYFNHKQPFTNVPGTSSR